MRRSRLVLILALILTTGLPAPPASPATPWPGFDDVTPSNIFYNDIVWLKDQAITLGCNPPANTMFCPEDPVTRGEMAAFLTRALNLTDAGTGDWFTDDDTSVFEADLDRAAHAGIVKGCDPPANTMACPDDPITRQQMASFLVRAFDLDKGGGLDWFEDDDTSIHQTDIDRLRAAWITYGCNPPTENRYCPTDPVTRQEMAAFLHRALREPVDGARMAIHGRLWPETLYRWGDLVATYELRASGSEPLSDVSLWAPDFGPCTSSSIVPPVPLLGDDDALLEPGELWNGWCAGVTGYAGELNVDGIGIALDGATVSARATLDVAISHPLRFWVSTSADAVPYGEVATWTLTATNPSDIPITLDVMHWEGEWPWMPMTGPTHVEGDGDDRLELDELWTYEASVVMFQPTAMQIAVSYDPVDVDGFTTTRDAPELSVDVIYPDIVD